MKKCMFSGKEKTRSASVSTLADQETERRTYQDDMVVELSLILVSESLSPIHLGELL